MVCQLVSYENITKYQRGHPLESSGHPLESSGQAGSCVFLVFHLKNQVFLLFKLTLNMATHPVMTSIGVNMHLGLNKERHMNLGSLIKHH